MLSAFELILAIKDYTDNDVKDTCEATRELLKNIKGSNFEHALKIALDEFIDCNCLCPICFSPMEEKYSYHEDRGEYMGTPCSEKMNIWGCSKCDYIYK